MGRIVGRVLATRVDGARGLVPLLLRLAAGAVFVGFSLGKFRRHAAESAAFDRYGVPFADVMTYVVGTLELVGGALLLAGLLVRPAALALAGNMAVATATAGRLEPGLVHTGLAPLLLVGAGVLVVTGAGRLSADARLARRAGRGTGAATAGA